LLLSAWLIAKVAVCLGLVEFLVPREGVELAASGPWWVRFEASWPVDYVDSGITQYGDTVLKSGVGGECAVDKGQHHDRGVEADGFREDSQGEVVADAVGPLVNCVVGSRCNDDGIGLG
jgi:hypothetical protein